MKYRYVRCVLAVGLCVCLARLFVPGTVKGQAPQTLVPPPPAPLSGSQTPLAPTSGPQMPPPPPAPPANHALPPPPGAGSPFRAGPPAAVPTGRQRRFRRGNAGNRPERVRLRDRIRNLFQGKRGSN